MNALKLVLLLVASALFYLQSYAIAIILFIVAFLMKDQPRATPSPATGIPPITAKYNAPYKIPKKMTLKYKEKTVPKTEWEQTIEQWLGQKGLGGFIGALIGYGLKNKKRKF